MLQSAELADFLRLSRAHLRPEDVGLPDDGRLRRVRALRREELAPSYEQALQFLARWAAHDSTESNRARPRS